MTSAGGCKTLLAVGRVRPPNSPGTPPPAVSGSKPVPGALDTAPSNPLYARSARHGHGGNVKFSSDKGGPEP